MFRALILPIFRSTRLCVTACGRMYPRGSGGTECLRFQTTGYRLATSWVHYTTSCNTESSAPEDGQNHARNMLSYLELLILVVYIICIPFIFCIVPQVRMKLKCRSSSVCSTCIPDGHLHRVTIPDAVLIQLTS